jgi:hypothetical protein
MLSEEWKTEALKRFPEVSKYESSEWDTPYSCWHSLLFLFEDAYREPRNESLIKRIYDYFKWCLGQPGGDTAKDDLPTIATLFLEEMPAISAAMEDMPRWIPYEAVQGSVEIFIYMVGEEGYKKILEVYKKWKEDGRPIRKLEDY